jgi:hypothetical protein
VFFSIFPIFFLKKFTPINIDQCGTAPWVVPTVSGPHLCTQILRFHVTKTDKITRHKTLFWTHHRPEDFILMQNDEHDGLGCPRNCSVCDDSEKKIVVKFVYSY